jgi:GR25 family glycosyltransferase involved in LPS biosynthesis
MNSLTPDDCYVAPGVAATWKSHQKAMSAFLESEDQYALILEDDFLVTKSWSLDLLNSALSTNPDFFQLGFLKTGPVDRFNLKLCNFQDSFLKSLLRFTHFSSQIAKNFGHRLLVSEQIGLAWNVVPNNIRAGGQAYVVSRQFAQAAQHMNTPAFTSADGMFMTLGDVRSFRMFRFRKSIINQTDSVTSVQQRYL